MKIQNQVSSVGIDALAAGPKILLSPIWCLQLPKTKTNKNHRQRQRQIQIKVKDKDKYRSKTKTKTNINQSQRQRQIKIKDKEFLEPATHLFKPSLLAPVIALNKINKNIGSRDCNFLKLIQRALPTFSWPLSYARFGRK